MPDGSAFEFGLKNDALCGNMVLNLNDTTKGAVKE